MAGQRSEWDKDDLDTLGILKIDVLGLGMLSCIRRGFDLLKQHYDKKIDLATVPAEDPVVYDMLCQADSVGVFRSRAGLNDYVAALKTTEFYDLVMKSQSFAPDRSKGIWSILICAAETVKKELVPIRRTTQGSWQDIRRTVISRTGNENCYYRRRLHPV